MSARPGEEIGWREVLLGRRFDTTRTEELDRKDLERGALCAHLYGRAGPNFSYLVAREVEAGSRR